MSEKVRILSFYENWVDIMEMCNPEEWYELTTIITNLRFKNIDTDPKTLTNIKVKMAWTAIRPSILKSNRNSRYQDKKSNTELQPNTYFEKEAEISPNKPNLAINDTEVPQEAESVSEEPKQGEFDNSIEMFEKTYSDNLINFVEKYSRKIAFIIETLSKYNINPNSVDYRTLEAEKDRMRKMINYLGGNTKDARDLEDFFNKRIDEAMAEIVLNEMRR
jgi:hypothetical protein